MLGLIGCKVRLHDIDDSRLKDLREAKGIQVEGPNGGFAPLEMAATALKASTAGVDIVIIVTGGNFQEKVAQSLAPLLQDGHAILIVYGKTCSSEIVRRPLAKAGWNVIVGAAERDN